MTAILRKPSAWVPIAMSAMALLLVVSYVALFGVQKSTGDESTIARIFQLLLAGQVPIVGYFIIKWFPKHQKQVLQIVVIQILAAIVPFLTVLFLEM
ncbi:hypothetical protein A2313_04835 [Candidatus Roizmanbacteria bacterium RIFOXYB2_FULL_41_10]|uniref:Uncharacterized protein n=1 Tax=Candidatus Roizmanbacteria bacterium RIFOXYA1_FULL_41_12 TaxID=1802082 RepID=A0A1F7K9H8_9BACT|nr:MAG: hypothetical protein A2209_02295 [Candidatus Roizmanbacteria bacterium RIFOXYA1_FULL_41_12]OGK68019.1 MAG: hypothetical protein A2377_03960 [Candidatus Roizmanbacteria bacterium RIFOXYB1_FULL_41_27]OGK69173.1 MAG: hypothetical protein A2313_04835 [Candidatus Roizmanbacteria bacterium RIFOXYB2_FULL_41_10]OGK72219.1 MAG: hypothetical protein A2403_04650 [Candidatus Roizmanbacteria bacterium RIFOXYC1_FULL_41_16]OGK75439.1 MAG: hypothetical protein A2575_04180 [Candidatus Roizmanbacteria ba